MSKYVLTGSSCCLKSTIGRELDGDLFKFIPSDSGLIKEMQQYNLITADFYPRLLFKGYLMRMLESKTRSLIYERSMIDQLTFARIMSTGWFDLDRELDYKYILDKTGEILEFEESIGISKYIMLENHNMTILESVLNDPKFEESSRYDSYYTIDDYFKFQEMFKQYYKEYISALGTPLEIIAFDYGDNIKDVIASVKSNVINALYK